MSMVKPPLPLLAAHPEWRIFPIARGRKSPPLFKNELELASNDRATVEQWAARDRGCNWGLALKRSHVIVLDVDTKPGKCGATTLERLELEHGLLPATFEVRSPSGGRHLYFTETNNVRHRMKLSGFGRDIDSTGYVLLPGSVLSGEGNGDTPGRYRTVVNAMVLPAPDWFAEYLAPSTIGDNATDQAPAVEQDTPHLIAWAIDYLKNAKPAVQYEHGEFTLLMVAAVLKDHGISQPMAVELLTEHYNARCNPPWEVGEGATADRLDVKVANAWIYLRGTQPGAHTAAVAFGDDSIDAAALDKIEAWWKEHGNKKPERTTNAVCINGVWRARRRDGSLRRIES
jgi:hypothetical protein